MERLFMVILPDLQYDLGGETGFQELADFPEKIRRRDSDPRCCRLEQPDGGAVSRFADSFHFGDSADYCGNSTVTILAGPTGVALKENNRFPSVSKMST
ncbi:MAG TPA: hypothetical protein VNQ79_16655 [Blastocatellia bacterium]|nr:hypothetical protein [Blastocatellia bacterium]